MSRSQTGGSAPFGDEFLYEVEVEVTAGFAGPAPALRLRRPRAQPGRMEQQTIMRTGGAHDGDQRTDGHALSAQLPQAAGIASRAPDGVAPRSSVLDP